MVYECFFGDIASQPMIESYRVNKSLKIKTNSIQSIQMDGDFKGKSDHIEVICKKQALNFMVDKDFAL